MSVRRLAVALAACCLQVRPAAADESINIFVAIDAAYYLGLVLCGMVRAYGEPSSAARRGRPFKFFVLHGPRLPATRKTRLLLTIDWHSVLNGSL